jgi:ABC-type Fe3+-hydroxamate transport system substrate-binding protein
VFADLSELAPQVGVEAVIGANPQVIIASADPRSNALASWQRWPQLLAVRAGTLFQLDSDDLSRPTPRLVRGTQAVCRSLETARLRLAKLQSRAPS